MLNEISIQGRLVADPELKRTNNDTAVLSMRIACDRDYAPNGQERETDFIDIVAWRGTAEFISKYWQKGQMILVTGRLQIRPWTDKDGNKRTSAEVVVAQAYFCGEKRSQSVPGTAGETTAIAPLPPAEFQMFDEKDDDLPF